jgi:hypothetical protein
LQQYTELKIGWWGPPSVSTIHSQFRTEPVDADFERHIEILETPKGALQQSILVSLKGQPGLHETHFIKSPEDAERYLTLPLTQTAGSVDSFQSACSTIGDAGIVEVGLGLNPAGCVVELMGSELFAMMSLTDREILAMIDTVISSTE